MTITLADLARILADIDADEPLEDGLEPPIAAELVWGLALVFAALEGIRRGPGARQQYIHRRFHRIGEDLAREFREAGEAKTEKLGRIFSDAVSELKSTLDADSQENLLAFLAGRSWLKPSLTAAFAILQRQERAGLRYSLPYEMAAQAAAAEEAVGGDEKSKKAAPQSGRDYVSIAGSLARPLVMLYANGSDESRLAAEALTKADIGYRVIRSTKGVPVARFGSLRFVSGSNIAAMAETLQATRRAFLDEARIAFPEVFAQNSPGLRDAMEREHRQQMERAQSRLNELLVGGEDSPKPPENRN